MDQSEGVGKSGHIGTHSIYQDEHWESSLQCLQDKDDISTSRDTSSGVLHHMTKILYLYLQIKCQLTIQVERCREDTMWTVGKEGIKCDHISVWFIWYITDGFTIRN